MSPDPIIRILTDLAKKQLPEHIKEMIVDDALPMDEPLKIMALAMIADDASLQTAKNAQHTLKEMPGDSVVHMLRTYAKLDARVFKGLLITFADSDKILSVLLTHKQFPFSLYESIATSEKMPMSVLEILSINQALFYKHPHLINLLLDNSRVTKEIGDRMLRYREGIIAEQKMRARIQEKQERRREPPPFVLDEEAEPAEEPAAPAPAAAPAFKETEKLASDAALIQDLYEEDKLFTKAVSETEPEQPKKRVPIRKFIAGLSVAGQIKLALKGNKEARSILIRSAKKIVARAVLQSPKLNEIEVEFYAKMRSISKEILRDIARNPEWTKKANIQRALLYNPKTPTPISQRYLIRLNEKELRSIIKSKSLPHALRIAARRIMHRKKSQEDKIRRARHSR